MKAKKFFRASRGLIATAGLSTGSDYLLGPGITQVLATPLASCFLQESQIFSPGKIEGTFSQILLVTTLS